jgi:hypothetical protein
MPGSFINVATIIHSDEALLATGFIFTVHFFNTHLRPEKFPMDTTVFTGHMPLAELKRDKPLEYEALVASGQLEVAHGRAATRNRGADDSAFAWVALSIGFSIVIWIIYAMLFRVSVKGVLEMKAEKQFGWLLGSVWPWRFFGPYRPWPPIRTASLVTAIQA